MNTLITHVLVYLASFVGIWLGSGLIVDSVTKLASNLKLPQFTLSFFVLGLLTSIPELVIGIFSIQNNEPEIFVGNLIGGVIILFMCIIPLLSIVNNGIKPPKLLNKKLLLLILVVSLSPSLLIGNKQIDNWEAVLCLCLYTLLIIFFTKKQSIPEKIKNYFSKKRKVSTRYLLVKIVLGIFIVVAASNQVVSSTLFFADVFKLNPFFVSLIIVAIGTNIPELALILRSAVHKDNEIVLADYLGSASANTFLFGFLTLLHPGTVIVPNSYIHRLLFVAISIITFYFFIRSKQTLSRSEGLVLLSMYFLFIFFELILIK